VQRSAIDLRNIAIGDFQKMNRILDACPLCHHEDKGLPPVAPLVSLATRVFLTLPTEPEISEGGACIVPIQHRGNLLECDDDEWEEIRVSLELAMLLYGSGRQESCDRPPVSFALTLRGPSGGHCVGLLGRGRV
jgi:hypothetical protein